MKILAIDTSSHGCSAAITDDHELLAEINLYKKETHSKHLMRIIHDIFGISGYSLAEMDGFAFSRGPGSFTGLRIGLSTIKGLAMATKKPVAGISSLDALALGVPYPECQICAIIDARKNEAFMARYSLFDGKLEKTMDECLVTPDKIYHGITGKTVFIGTGVQPYYETIRKMMGENALFVQDENHFVKARNVAVLSHKCFETNNFDDLSLFVPRYIRKSDAEINRITNAIKPLV